MKKINFFYILLILVGCRQDVNINRDSTFSMEQIIIPKNYKKNDFTLFLKSRNIKIHKFDGNDFLDFSFYRDTVEDNFIILDVFNYKDVPFDVFKDNLFDEDSLVKLVQSNDIIDIYRLTTIENKLENLEKSKYPLYRSNKNEFFTFRALLNFKKDTVCVSISNFVNFNEKNVSAIDSIIGKIKIQASPCVSK